MKIIYYLIKYAIKLVCIPVRFVYNMYTFMN